MLPWVEKYRPSTIDDLILDPHVISKLRSFTAETVPNLLCSGSPGVGKTSTALIIAKKLCGDEYIELNASDNRGINMISDMISSFCRSSTTKTKIIILDEADNITKKAQQLLINFMENYPKIRIFFTCNDFDQIIEPLQSRCMLMNFPRATKAQVMTLLSRIFTLEKVRWDEDAITEIIEHVNWDMRACINACQAISVSNEATINKENVVRYFCTPDISDVYKLLTMKTLDEAVDYYLFLTRSGISNIDVMTTLISGLQMETVPKLLSDLPKDKLYAILRHAHCVYYRMLQTIDSISQMVYFLNEIVELCSPSSCRSEPSSVPVT